MRDRQVTLLGYMRYGIGAAMLFGITPQYLALWLLWKVISLLLPSWLYQWGDDKLYSLYQRLVLFFFEHCTGVEVIMYGDTEELLKRKENIIYSANHQSTVDWMVANMISVRGGNIGHLRYVMKDSLQLIPLYGWYFHVHGCIYVKRGNFNKHKMVEALNYLTNDKINTWLVIFPEGTCYTPSWPAIISDSEKYAVKCGKEPLKYHLFPKHRGTWLALQHLQHKLDAIYDVNVFYEGSIDPSNGLRRDSPQLLEFLKGACSRVHIKVRRIPISHVPKNEEHLKTWLYDRFSEKDKLMAPFFNGVLNHSACSLTHKTLDVSSDQTARLNEQASGHPQPTSALKKLPDGRTVVDYEAVSRFYKGTKNSLSWWETLPSFLIFFSLSFTCVYFPWARKAYLNLLLYGTLGAYGWLAVRNVC